MKLAKVAHFEPEFRPAERLSLKVVENIALE